MIPAKPISKLQITARTGADLSAMDPRVFRRRIYLLLSAVVSLLATWYFAFAIAPSALVASGPAVPADLYPAWYASRQVLFHHGDPYSPEVTRQIQVAIFGDAAAASEVRNQQRFAYPLYSVVLFVPFALLPFPVAQAVAFALFLVLTICSVFWWLPRATAAIVKLTAVTFLLASYPIVLGLQLRQPTVLIAALLAAVVFCLRSKRLVLAGVLAALSTAKPQLAVAILLPLLIWTLVQWRERKLFAISFALCEAALLAASELMLRGWLIRWWQTLHAYVQYAGARPRLLFLLSPRAGWLASALLAIAVVWISWKWRDSDLLFAIGFSVAAFQLIFPFQIYNEVLLLPAILWLALRSGEYQRKGQLFTLLPACIWIVLGAGFISTLALSIAHFIRPGSAARLIAFPMSSVWLLPYAMFLVFVFYAGFGPATLPDRSYPI
jgi:hypothetical protein